MENKTMLNIIIAGLPGSGKGTQAEKLAARHEDMVHLETGKILRETKKKDSDTAKEVRKFMDKGELVPDELINIIVRQYIDDSIKGSSGFIFDGYPRTLQQAEFLDQHMEKYDAAIDHYIFLKVSEEELVKRMQGRGREDDKDPGVVRKRIERQNENTHDIKRYYEGQDKVIEINGEQDIETIFNEILHNLPQDKFKKSS